MNALTPAKMQASRRANNTHTRTSVDMNCSRLAGACVDLFICIVCIYLAQTRVSGASHNEMEHSMVLFLVAQRPSSALRSTAASVVVELIEPFSFSTSVASASASGFLVHLFSSQTTICSSITIRPNTDRPSRNPSDPPMSATNWFKS